MHQSSLTAENIAYECLLITYVLLSMTLLSLYESRMMNSLNLASFKAMIKNLTFAKSQESDIFIEGQFDMSRKQMRYLNHFPNLQDGTYLVAILNHLLVEVVPPFRDPQHSVGVFKSFITT